MTRRRLLRSFPVAAAALAGCEGPPPPLRYRLPQRPLQVITSTVQAADLIRRLGGEAVSVTSLIPPGANPHLWVPNAAEIATLQIADVFFLSGLGLEKHFIENLDQLRSRGLFVGVLANGLEDADILETESGTSDPHFWMDPRLWAKAAKNASTVLAEAYPPAAAWFMDRGHEHGVELQQEHQFAAARFAETAPRARFILTSHDSMAYFAAAYGLEARSVGNAAGEASVRIQGALATWLETHRIRTLFRESCTGLATIKNLARPLFLNPDLQIFSLSLAPRGTLLPSTISQLDVGEYLPAFRYTIEAILSRTAGE